MDKIFFSDPNFRMFSTEHFLSILTFLSLGIIFIAYSRRQNKPKQVMLLFGLAVLLSASVISWGVIEWSLGRFHIETDLPLVFCNGVALLLPLYFLKRNQLLFDFIYFVIIVGAVQAIITPALKFSIPHYEYWKFWLVHVGLIVFILYEIIIFRKTPSLRGIFTTFGLLQVYLLLVIGINYSLGSNYLFLNQKPHNASLLDLLGEWPYYILFMDLLLIPYFFISYCPFLLKKLRSD